MVQYNTNFIAFGFNEATATTHLQQILSGRSDTDFMQLIFYTSNFSKLVQFQDTYQFSTDRALRGPF